MGEQEKTTAVKADPEAGTVSAIPMPDAPSATSASSAADSKPPLDDAEPHAPADDNNRPKEPRPPRHLSLPPCSAVGLPAASAARLRVVGWAIDTTGQRLIDEICQIAAHTSHGAHFSQYVMPFNDIPVYYRRRHSIRIVTAGHYRMMKDMRTNKFVRTKSEVAALGEFLDWLEAQVATEEGGVGGASAEAEGDGHSPQPQVVAETGGDGGGDVKYEKPMSKKEQRRKSAADAAAAAEAAKPAYDGVVLVFHAFHKRTPAMLIETMRKHGLYERFTKVVKGFANVFDVARAKCEDTLRSFGLRTMTNELLSRDDSIDSAMTRAKACYDICEQITRMQESPTPVKKESQDHAAIDASGDHAASAGSDVEAAADALITLLPVKHALVAQLVAPFGNPLVEEERDIDAFKVLLNCQNTFKPVFGAYMRATPPERKYATHLRRILATAGLTYERLGEVFATDGRDGLAEIINEKAAEAQEADREELVTILDCFFDPEKKACVPKPRMRITPRNRSGGSSGGGGGAGRRRVQSYNEGSNRPNQQQQQQQKEREQQPQRSQSGDEAQVRRNRRKPRRPSARKAAAVASTSSDEEQPPQQEGEGGRRGRSSSRRRRGSKQQQQEASPKVKDEPVAAVKGEQAVPLSPGDKIGSPVAVAVA